MLLTNYNINSTTISNEYKDKNKYRISRTDYKHLALIIYPYLLKV